MPIEFAPEIAKDIPAEVANHQEIQRYNDLPSLLKGHIEAVNFRGQALTIPKADSKPEDLDKWAGETSAKLKDRGYSLSKISDLPPADVNGYDFKFENVDPKVISEDKVLAAFKPLAHKIGLNNSQAQGLVEWFAKDLAPMFAAPEKEFITGDKVMTMLSEAFPGKSEKALEDYKRSVQLFAATEPELGALLDQEVPYGENQTIALGDHPIVIRLLSQLANITAPDFTGNLQGHSGTASKDADSLVAEAKDIINNPSNAKHDLYLKGDPTVHKHIAELFAKAYPGETTI